MALYDGATYRSGYQGYLCYLPQSGRLVPPSAVADPVEQTVTALAGYVESPLVQTTEGVQEVEAPGLMRTATTVHGRREHSLSTRIIVADGTFLIYAVRNHADPGAAGTIAGLQLLALEFGAFTDFGGGFAEQGIDCLFNSLRLSWAENQPVVATVELIPTCIIPATGQAAQTPTAPVLHWCHSSWTVGGVDYHPIWSGTTISIINNVERVGTRQQLGAAGSELAISRTAYHLQPQVEKLQVQHTLKDRLPDELRDSDDWGTLTLRAEEPGTGAGRQYLQITIDHNFLNQYGQQQVPAGRILSWSIPTVSSGVTIEAGLTDA